MSIGQEYNDRKKMSVFSLRIDREAVNDEIDEIDGVMVRVPRTLKKRDAERMIISNIPNLQKYPYKIYRVDVPFNKKGKPAGKEV